MAVPFIKGRNGWAGELFPGEEQHFVAALALERTPAGKDILFADPANVDAGRLIDPRAGVVKRFVAECLDHLPQLRLGALTPNLCNQTNNAWHFLTRLPLLSAAS